MSQEKFGEQELKSTETLSATPFATPNSTTPNLTVPTVDHIGFSRVTNANSIEEISCTDTSATLAQLAETTDSELLSENKQRRKKLAARMALVPALFTLFLFTVCNAYMTPAINGSTITRLAIIFAIAWLCIGCALALLTRHTKLRAFWFYALFSLPTCHAIWVAPALATIFTVEHF